MTAASAAPAAAAAHPPRETFKETFISIIIAFVLAFVFRGFVVEAFVIPTGSMAPTLMGAHMRFRASESGYTWPVQPWQFVPNTEGEEAMPIQTNIVVHDPMTGQRVIEKEVPRRSGDRILVLKFLYGLVQPHRFDVVVFKCPYMPGTNFIKRLLGLPGEMIALVDGDVFVRDASLGTPPADAAAGAAADTWALPGWTIARKPIPVQQAVWQPVFDSRYAPINPVRDGRPWYHSPWTGSTPGWTIGGPIYEFDASTPTRLAWDAAAVRYQEPGPFRPELWEIDDRYPYDETSDPNHTARFPVSDVRLRAGIEPRQDGLHLAATVRARAHEFEAVIDGGTATLRMRGGGADDTAPDDSSVAWKTLATVSIPPLPAGQVTDVEFWHVDQSLQLWIAGRRVAYAEYDWSPAQRIRFATGRDLDALLAEERSPARDTGRGTHGNILADSALYRRPEVHWSFSGAPLRLHRVGLDRDLHYQAAFISDPGSPLRDTPALATHPRNTPVLSPTAGGGEFFVCGDNSPASKDGRLWDQTDPWVRTIDDKIGVVPRDLMIGKAFFVYFPSLNRDGPIPVPDFGRLRFIR